MNKPSKGSIVYSTNPEFDAAELEEKEKTKASINQTIYLHLERKGGGKIITIIKGYPEIDRLMTIAKEIKKFCGAGGTIKDNNIIIQGNNRDKIFHYLEDRGYSVKQSGG